MAGIGRRHPLPSGGTVIRGAAGTSSSSGGGWELLFLRWDFFLWWDHYRGALRDWDVLFLRWDRNSFGLRQQDLLFNNVHVLHIGDLLFIVHNIHHQLEWRDRFITKAAS
jgi:hypothetical protein